MRAHWIESGAEITAETLCEHGVYYANHDPDERTYRAPIDHLKAERGYVHEDEVALRPDTPGLAQICDKFIDEHSHDDDEVRFVLQGEGIFDIRSNEDAWMRVLVEPGDLIVVPRDRHHRFMLTDSKMIRCVRLFRDAAGWEPHYR